MTNDIPPATGPKRAGQVAIALTVGVLGFLLATQLRSQQGLADRLAIERESDLGRILAELGARADELTAEIVDLGVRLARSAGSEEQERALIRSAERELEALRILLGAVPVEGEGIVMRIDDPRGTVAPELLLDAVQELRDAGAEAIDVGGVRVVASTALGGAPGAVRAADVLVRAPYEITAIGPRGTLAEAMRIPGGVVDAVRAVSGASVRIEERASIRIGSTRAVPTFRFARPRR